MVHADLQHCEERPFNASIQEKYIRHTEKVMESVRWPWPKDVVLDGAKLPHFVESVDAFLQELQFGDHMDRIVVFPNGLQKLGQEAALHPAMREVLLDPAVLTGYDVLERLSSTGVLHEWRGCVAYLDTKDPHNRRESHASGSREGRLSEKFENLKEQCPESARHSVYLSEIRCHGYNGDMLVPGLHAKRKSTMTTTMRERASRLGVNVQNMMYWDDYSEGLFISGHGAGFDMHQDCIQTSNVGSVFEGHKLLAIWSYPDETLNVLGNHYGTIFVPPLLESQVEALQQSRAIALAPPGSVYIFSGCNAHVVCNIGVHMSSDCQSMRPSPCVSSYEAFVNLHEKHALALARTHVRDFHYKKTWMSHRGALREFHEDIAKFIHHCLGQLTSSSDAVAKQASRAIDVICTHCPRVCAYVQKLKEMESDSCTESTNASSESATKAIKSSDSATKKRKRNFS